MSGFASGACVGVGAGFNDDVSSFGPDPGLTCNIFSDAGCTGRETGNVINPGRPPLLSLLDVDARLTAPLAWALAFAANLRVRPRMLSMDEVAETLVYDFCELAGRSGVGVVRCGRL